MDGYVRRARIAWMRAQGMTNREIARELDVAPSTVTYHTDVIQEKAQENDDYVRKLLNMAENVIGL